MKNLILTLPLIFSLQMAHAKLTVFKNQDAVQMVLKDPGLIKYLAGQQQSGADMFSASVRAFGKDLKKTFVVRLKQSTNTPMGERSCYTDIQVRTEIVAVRNQNEASMLISRLAIQEIGNTICGKNSPDATRIQF